MWQISCFIQNAGDSLKPEDYTNHPPPLLDSRFITVFVRAVVVAQLAERLLPTSEIHGLNPNINEVFWMYICHLQFKRDGNKEKERLAMAQSVPLLVQVCHVVYQLYLFSKLLFCSFLRWSIAFWWTVVATDLNRDIGATNGGSATIRRLSRSKIQHLVTGSESGPTMTSTTATTTTTTTATTTSTTSRTTTTIILQNIESKWWNKQITSQQNVAHMSRSLLTGKSIDCHGLMATDQTPSC